MYDRVSDVLNSPNFRYPMDRYRPVKIFPDGTKGVVDGCRGDGGGGVTG